MIDTEQVQHLVQTKKNIYATVNFGIVPRDGHRKLVTGFEVIQEYTEYGEYDDDLVALEKFSKRA